MSQLQLAGMRAAYDEIVTTGVKRSTVSLPGECSPEVPVENSPGE
jgi:hypothetical protein